MDFWGYRIDTTLEWVALVLLLVLCVVAYFYLVWFIQKFTTGLVGGFLLLFGGFALVMFPAYNLIWSELPKAQVLVNGAAIMVGCVSLLVGAFKLTNFNDF